MNDDLSIALVDKTARFSNTLAPLLFCTAADPALVDQHIAAAHTTRFSDEWHALYYQTVPHISKIRTRYRTAAVFVHTNFAKIARPYAAAPVSNIGIARHAYVTTCTAYMGIVLLIANIIFKERENRTLNQIIADVWRNERNAQMRRSKCAATTLTIHHAGPSAATQR